MRWVSDGTFDVSGRSDGCAKRVEWKVRQADLSKPFRTRHPAIPRESVQLSARPGVLARCDDQQQQEHDNRKPCRPLGRAGGVLEEVHERVAGGGIERFGD